MLLSLVDVFRCPADHEDTALVLSVDAWHGQRIDRGLLGCPVCHARYAIENGAVDFRSQRGAPASAVVADALSPDEVDRVQALLNLAEPGGVVLLSGRYAAAGPALAERIEIVCLLIGATGESERCVGVLLDDRLPIAAGSLRAAALEAPGPALIQQVVRSIRGGGRLLLDGPLALPVGVRELATDDRSWLGQVLEQPAVISLKRPVRS